MGKIYDCLSQDVRFIETLHVCFNSVKLTAKCPDAVNTVYHPLQYPNPDLK